MTLRNLWLLFRPLGVGAFVKEGVEWNVGSSNAPGAEEWDRHPETFFELWCKCFTWLCAFRSISNDGFEYSDRGQ